MLRRSMIALLAGAVVVGTALVSSTQPAGAVPVTTEAQLRAAFETETAG